MTDGKEEIDRGGVSDATSLFLDGQDALFRGHWYPCAAGGTDHADSVTEGADPRGDDGM
ncbi:hypothetical protein IMZ11_29575 [Microtetraspora sp. AC03309]|uniref:hypothetical protein n=1 Tax=Microtetraspora sp. AC03309 TaxID=2779376 RepID=UPI001E504FD3|nr:hypothetical protein [Microtetraspora sp. AC03309]MCC5579784.1 hypothetical protein [Microtetraspora sp. AC03309]